MPKSYLKPSLTFLLVFSILSVYAQTLQVSNKAPQPGETVLVTFYPRIDQDSTAVILWAYAMEENGTFRILLKSMQYQGGKHQLPLKVGDQWASAELYVLSKDLAPQEQTLKIKDASGRARRNSHNLELRWRPGLIRKALEAYPENHAAYRWRWEGLFSSGNNFAKAWVLKELGELDQQGLTSEEYLYSRVAGLYMLDSTQACAAALKEFWTQYPMSSYWYDLRMLLEGQSVGHTFASEPIPGLGTQLMTWAAEIPESPLAQSILHYFREGNRLSHPETVRKIVEAALLHPVRPLYELHMYQALALTERTAKRRALYTAYNLVRQEFILDQALSLDRKELEEFFWVLAREFLLLEEYSWAQLMLNHLAQTAAAQPEYHMLSAKALLGLTQHQAAVDAYFRAYLAGNASAFQEARMVFDTHLATATTTFDQYRLSFALKLLRMPNGLKAPAIPNRSVQGNRLTWSELKGQPTVLGFFIGSRAQEKELLSSFVTMSQQLTNCHALAVTYLEEEKLKQILGEIPTEPHLLPLAESTFVSWSITNTPVYAIVDATGNIRLSFIESKLLSQEDIPLIVKALQKVGE
ncbi:MAG TPA: hypothetical protein DCE41_36865 [Cytophagales bacterium]|nr:hypothetical protein [Cytophagales bacterium]HAA17648.1 hypothetical protein [Cytophagales bacterium]